MRILVADDHGIVRAGIRLLLELQPDLDVIAEAADGVDAVEQALAVRPALCILDVGMPRMTGLQAARAIRSHLPDTRVLMLSMHDNIEYVTQAVRAGAAGYVLKDSQPAAIVSSILAVMAGERVMASAVANRVLDMLTGTMTPKEYYDGLTAREVEILKLLAAGQANKQIARRLQISEKTVRNHVSHMYEKLKIYDRSQAVLYAVRKGLIDP